MSQGSVPVTGCALCQYVINLMPLCIAYPSSPPTGHGRCRQHLTHCSPSRCAAGNAHARHSQARAPPRPPPLAPPAIMRAAGSAHTHPPLAQAVRGRQRCERRRALLELGGAEAGVAGHVRVQQGGEGAGAVVGQVGGAERVVEGHLWRGVWCGVLCCVVLWCVV